MTLKEKAKKAREYGKKACKEGLGQIPAYDQRCMDLVKGIPVGGGSFKVMKAWIHGWHEEMDREIFEENNPEEPKSKVGETETEKIPDSIIIDKFKEDLKELYFRIGELRSELDEVKHENENFVKRTKYPRKKRKKEDYYINLIHKKEKIISKARKDLIEWREKFFKELREKQEVEERLKSKRIKKPPI